MNNNMIDTRDVILSLKHVKREKRLSLDKILDMMQEKDPATAVSKTTLSRVFAKGSEDQLFRYETTLRPIANALLDMEEIESGDDIDTQAMKSILKLKKDLIFELESKLQTIQSEEQLKYHQKLEKETAKFQKSLDFLREQINLKDKRIDQLLDANMKLLNQLLTCPCRKGDPNVN